MFEDSRAFISLSLPDSVDINFNLNIKKESVKILTALVKS